MDSTKISWTSSLKSDLEKNIEYRFERSNIVNALYRPYSKNVMYFGGGMTHRVGKFPKIFPTAESENRVISVTGRGATKEFTALITDILPDLEMVSKGQCFPLSIYEANSSEQQRTAANSSEQQRTAANSSEQQRTAANSSEQQPLYHKSTTCSIDRTENLVICLSVTGGKGFSALMSNCLPDLHLIGDAQCFPMYIYEEESEK